MAKKYGKKDRVSKKTMFKVMKNYRNAVADLNDLAWNLSQIGKFIEANSSKKELTDAFIIAADSFDTIVEAEDIAVIARIWYTAIDGFMGTVANCTGLNEVTKRTPVREFADKAVEVVDKPARDELVLAIKDWAKDWYAQYKDDIDRVD